MSKKRIRYTIDAPGNLWWVRGQSKPLPFDHPDAIGKNRSSHRCAKTMSKALRVLANAPPGSELTRFMSIRRRRGKRYMLREWVKR